MRPTIFESRLKKEAVTVYPMRKLFMRGAGGSEVIFFHSV